MICCQMYWIVCSSNWFLNRSFLAPSQSLDWQGAARPTGGAFVATLDSFGVCFSGTIMPSKTSYLRVCNILTRPRAALKWYLVYIVMQALQ